MTTLFKTYELVANTAQAVVRNTYSLGAVVTVNITNRNTSTVTFRVAVTADQNNIDDHEWIVWDKIIYSKDVYVIEGLCLAEGEYVVVRSNASSVGVQVWGVTDTSTSAYTDDIVQQLPPDQFVGRLAVFFMGNGLSGSAVTPSRAVGDIDNLGLYSGSATSYTSYSSNKYYLNGWDTDGTKVKGIGKYGTGTVLIYSADSTLDNWYGSWPVDPPALVNTAKYWTSLAYGGGKWVAITNGGQISTDTTGLFENGTWVTTTAPTGTNYWMVRYGGGRFVAVTGQGGSLETCYSTNGTTWVAGGNLPSGAQMNFVATMRSTFWYANSLFHMVDVSAANTLRITTSPDAVTWTTNTRTLTGLTAGVYTLTAYGSGRYVTLQSGSTTSWTSTDGINWTANANAIPSGYSQYSFSSILYAGNRFFAMSGNPNSIWASTDGVTWVKGASAFVASENGMVYLPV